MSPEEMQIFCDTLPHKTQAAADERSDVREMLRTLRLILEEQLAFENVLVEDEPEGTVSVDLTLSKTLAEKMARSFARAEALI